MNRYTMDPNYSFEMIGRIEGLRPFAPTFELGFKGRIAVSVVDSAWHPTLAYDLPTSVRSYRLQPFQMPTERFELSFFPAPNGVP